MQLSQQEREILRNCIQELESTLTDMSAKEADLRVGIVAHILTGFLIEKE